MSPKNAGKAFDTNQAGEVRYGKTQHYKPKSCLSRYFRNCSVVRAFTRSAEIISTGSQSLSYQEKMILAQVATIKRNHDAIDNSVILMAVDLLKTGKYTLQSDDYDRNEVDFKRTAALNYTPSTLWNANGATPVDDIRRMLERQLEADGGEAEVAR